MDSCQTYLRYRTDRGGPLCAGVHAPFRVSPDGGLCERCERNLRELRRTWPRRRWVRMWLRHFWRVVTLRYDGCHDLRHLCSRCASGDLVAPPAP